MSAIFFRGRLLLPICIVGIMISRTNEISVMFRREQIIFSSDYNITKVLVPADLNSFIQVEPSDLPTIFFTITDPRLEGGSCIYALEGFAAYEILEGGRDSTADYSFNRDIYFGAKDGLYKYTPNSFSAKRFGSIRDDIIQLQKANGSDTIFILTAEHRIYRIENNGTRKTRISTIRCALQFVLDTSNNIYFVACDDLMPHVINRNGKPRLLAPGIEEFTTIQLLRPAFIMEQSVLFFGNNNLYILYANGTTEKKDFVMKESPSAFSIDAGLYLVAALKGKIYEFNLMDMLLRSMFSTHNDWTKEVTKLIMSIIENGGDNLFKQYPIIRI